MPHQKLSALIDAICSFVICNDSSLRGQPIIFNPDFFVEKLRHEKPEVFTELVVSNITRLIDLPGTELAQLMGEVDLKLPGGAGAASGFFRSLMSLKRKEKGVIFGSPLTEEGIAQIYQLIEYLHKNLRVEGLFRVPGNSVRQQILRDALNNGTDIDLESGEFHSNDVATLLKMFLGELPEPLLTHKHFNAHLKIADLMQFDDKGNKTNIPDKDRQIEALQLLFLILPPPNRNLLKLLLDLLYQTAKKQDKNKMSAYNLALMFAPHVLWPKNVTANDLQENITKLNSGMAFMIKHSQKLFKAPAYIRDGARLHYLGSRTQASKDDLDLIASCHTKSFQLSKSQKRNWIDSCPHQEETQQHTEEALRELFQHVHNMPESAKKKQLIRQFNKHSLTQTPGREPSTYQVQKRARSRSFSGLIKRKVLGNQMMSEKKKKNPTPESVALGELKGASKENMNLLFSGSPAVMMTPTRLKWSEGKKERKKVLEIQYVFTPTTHLNSDESHLKCSIAPCPLSCGTRAARGDENVQPHVPVITTSTTRWHRGTDSSTHPPSPLSVGPPLVLAILELPFCFKYEESEPKEAQSLHSCHMGASGRPGTRRQVSQTPCPVLVSLGHSVAGGVAIAAISVSHVSKP
uniref:rho GTPase-activating protein 19 isoform X4 n=1 Tax=Callithrix jacchus TaxID=9483 RepID=UPI00159DF1DA|nr:rho GTPase-activating protein 19 isoform X4 [Callithrix jacchus]